MQNGGRYPTGEAASSESQRRASEASAATSIAAAGLLLLQEKERAENGESSNHDVRRATADKVLANESDTCDRNTNDVPGTASFGRPEDPAPSRPFDGPGRNPENCLTGVPERRAEGPQTHPDQRDYRGPRGPLQGPSASNKHPLIINRRLPPPHGSLPQAHAIGDRRDNGIRAPVGPGAQDPASRLTPDAAHRSYDLNQILNDSFDARNYWRHRGPAVTLPQAPARAVGHHDHRLAPRLPPIQQQHRLGELGGVPQQRRPHPIAMGVPMIQSDRSWETAASSTWSSASQSPATTPATLQSLRSLPESPNHVSNQWAAVNRPRPVEAAAPATTRLQTMPHQDNRQKCLHTDQHHNAGGDHDSQRDEHHQRSECERQIATHNGVQDQTWARFARKKGHVNAGKRK